MFPGASAHGSRSAQAVITIVLEERPALFQVQVVLRGVRHERREHAYRRGGRHVQFTNVGYVVLKLDLPENEPLHKRGDHPKVVADIDPPDDLAMKIEHLFRDACGDVVGKVHGTGTGVVVAHSNLAVHRPRAVNDLLVVSGGSRIERQRCDPVISVLPPRPS